MKSLSQQDRINAIAPRVRELVGQYASGTFAEGGEALNAQVTELVETAGLAEVRSNVAVDKVGSTCTDKIRCCWLFDVYGISISPYLYLSLSLSISVYIFLSLSIYHFLSLSLSFCWQADEQ